MYTSFSNKKHPKPNPMGAAWKPNFWSQQKKHPKPNPMGAAREKQTPKTEPPKIKKIQLRRTKKVCLTKNVRYQKVIQH